MWKAYGLLVRLSFDISTFTLAAYQRGHLPRPLIRNLILKLASRLDAFSAYPFRTQLPGGAIGITTGTLEVRPTRSSRTNVSSPQISYAHNR